MTAAAVHGDERPRGEVPRGVRAAIPPIIPPTISVLTLLILSGVIAWGAGHPERFPSAGVYDATLSVVTLARLGPIFFSGLLVWPAMRLRGASMKWAAVGTLATPVVFAVLSAVGHLTYFPPAEAAYYALNPIVLGALGAQCAWAAVGEVFVRWRRGGRAALTAPILLIAGAVVLLGLGLLYAGVIWDGGKHVFYLWMTGFTAIFGTGQ